MPMPPALVRIDVSFSGALGKNPAEQLQLVLDGTADLAFVVPGYTPERFRDNTVIELPGQFRNIREATEVYSRLVADNALNGYDDLFVVGAFATEPESIHANVPIASLADLEGKRIRANNPIESAALERLGMVAVQIPINKISAAISSGEIDGAAVPPAPLIEFGIARVAAHHYLLGVASAPLTVVMNRAKVRESAGGGARPHPKVQRRMDGRALYRHLRSRECQGDRSAECRSQPHGLSSLAVRP